MANGLSIQRLGFYEELALAELGEELGSPVYFKPKTVLKFGRFSTLGTSLETVQTQGGNETYLNSNTPAQISSSDNGDTQPVIIEYHYWDAAGVLQFAVSSLTLTGNTPVPIPQDAVRWSRLKNDGTVDFAGTVYISEQSDTVILGVPQTAAKIHVRVSPGNNQTEKASTTFGTRDHAVLTSISASVTLKTNATAEFYLETRKIVGDSVAPKVFRNVYEFGSATNAGTMFIPMRPYFILGNTCDVRVRAIGSTTNVEVDASFHVMMAREQLYL